ncbi:MAG: nitrate reductase subunit beta [Rothia sp. (in: high G+C Gram-positive bacteria)]|nr:nitrate reductase subunit beta [Rothia sp. (in: high G+C Gram-positive bacteria)]
MRVMAQVSMIMALDKCLGCHTCSVTCKQAWTNRAGTEYVWFNNVETRPGQGYPRRYEDQEKWKGGWVLNKRGRLELKSGNRFKKLFTLFASPVQPELSDYYEPWTYDYENLTSAPLGDDFPTAKPKSLITGEDTSIEWGPNWDDNLGGTHETGNQDPLVEKVLQQSEEKIKFEFERTFMFYLPRICEHCLNPSCMASCPSGAIYKREEDGIVLVDQNQCRGWRQCITGCPYKKIYFNHKSGKAEKCTFCYPRIEHGIPTVCAETCVGRMRYIGIFLYDADRVTEAASVADEKKLYAAQLDIMLDPHDPEIIRQAKAQDIPDSWIEAAQKSPVYKLAKEWKIALPLHPEYRTMPMVWYVPPLSPIIDLLKDQGHDAESQENLFGAIDSLRIPVEYLAELFTAGDTGIIVGVLKKLAAMRAYMRDITLGGVGKEEIAQAVGMTGAEIYEMYRLMAISKYEERYVIPPAHLEDAHTLEEIGCYLDKDGGPGMLYDDAFNDTGARPVPVSAGSYANAQRADGKVNIFMWDGKTRPDSLFPDTSGSKRV